MKKIIYIIILTLFFVPIMAHAEDTTNQFYIKIDIQENGDLLVKELATLSGNYNGRFRTLEWENKNARKFTGDLDSFYGSDIYNGKGITDLKVGKIDADNNKITWDSFNKEYTPFEQGTAQVGDYGKYELIESSDGIKIKTFMPSAYKGAFYIEYTIKDVVVVHNDVAEINWNLLGKTNEENIEDFEARVTLPHEDQDLRVWLKGDKNTLNGKIERINNEQANIYFDFLGKYNPVTVRLMFNKDQVPNATKYSNVDGKEKILEVEKKNAKEANKLRNKIKNQVKLAKSANILWIVVFLTTIVIIYFKYDKEYKTEFQAEYLRELPSDLPPEQVEYVMTKKVSNNGLSSSICNMVLKRVFRVVDDPENKKNYIIVADDKKLDLLTEDEKAVYELLINTVGNGKSVTTKELKNYGKSTLNATNFINQFSKWKKSVEAKGKDLNIYETNKKGIIVIMLLLSFASYGIFTMNMSFDFWIGIGTLIFVFGIIGFIYTLLVNKKTKTGIEEYTKWKAFKKFLKDFGRFNEKELPEIALWEKYLVYATALGCAKEVQKAMSIKINELYPNGLNNTDPTFSDYYMMNSIINMNMAETISTTVGTAVSASRSSIAQSSSSSGSGFGGGSSFGGGFGGGGGGSGRF